MSYLQFAAGILYVITKYIMSGLFHFPNQSTDDWGNWGIQYGLSSVIINHPVRSHANRTHI